MADRYNTSMKPVPVFIRYKRAGYQKSTKIVLDLVLNQLYTSTYMTTLIQSNQVKITLPLQLHGFLKTKADRLGLPVAAYVKNLIIDDIKDTDIPTFPLSEKQEKKGLQALKEYKAGKTSEITDIEAFFKNL